MGGMEMKEIKIKLRSSFTTKNREQLQKAITKKVEKLANTKLKKTE